MPDLLTENVIGAAIEVHRIHGPGLLESIYEEAFCHELTLRSIQFDRQLEVDVLYKGIIIKGQRIDLIVERELILELKCVTRLPEVASPRRSRT
jgi:GxxExxY protein